MPCGYQMINSRQNVDGVGLSRPAPVVCNKDSHAVYSSLTKMVFYAYLLTHVLGALVPSKCSPIEIT